MYGAIQVLRNADGGVSHFPEKNVTKVSGSTLFSIARGVGGGTISRKKALHNT